MFSRRPTLCLLRNFAAPSLLFFLVCAVSHATGTAANSALPASAFTAQLIVKFKPATISCDPAGIARLSGELGTRLEWLRPMSGDACVLRHTGYEGESVSLQWQRLTAVLQSSPWVEWVEPDGVAKALQR